MLKRFCNRCGKEIGKEDRGFVHSRIHYGDVVFCNSLSDDDRYYDLCKDCVISFQIWMEAGKNAAD